uniref:Uncharacterized protein n=1 Tax=Dictyoglomus turgidum TaxID=513050 RepID=A0A7C3SMP1_9BACT
MKRTADLYNEDLYTIVRKDLDVRMGIFPEDQDLSPTHVILWNSIMSIPFSLVNKDNKILQVRVSFKDVRKNLINLGGGAYGLEYIPNFCILKEVTYAED